MHDAEASPLKIRMPRLAIVTTMSIAAWGGSEELWADTARAASDAGWRVHASVNELGGRIPQHERLLGHHVEIARRSSPFARGFRLNKGWAKLRSPLQSIERFNPDVLLISQGGTYDIVANDILFRALNRSRLRSKPWVILCHLTHDEPPPNQWRQRAKGLFSDAHAVLFVAARNLRQVERHLGLDLPNASVVRNPVNMDDTSPLPWPQSDCARFASVARLDVPYKGQDLLLEALAGEEWRSREWTLSLYGDGADKSYIADLVRFYGLGDHVRLEGKVADVKRIWSREQLLLLPSRHEGTPLALVEAMLCGRPVLATRIAGHDEWIQDGQSGFLAEAPSVESISEALHRAWTQKDNWAAMGINSRIAAESRFDPEPGKSLLLRLEKAVERAGRCAKDTRYADGLRAESTSASGSRLAKPS